MGFSFGFGFLIRGQFSSNSFFKFQIKLDSIPNPIIFGS